MSLCPVRKPDPHREGRAHTNFAAILSSSSSLYRLKYTVPPSLAMRLRDVRVRPKDSAGFVDADGLARRRTKRPWMTPELV